MVLVEREHARVIDNAIERARTGHPTVLVVEGAPGAGKSTLLGHIAGRAEGYQFRTAEGDDGEHRSPFQTLESWGVTVARGADGAIPSPFVVAQHLRDLVDDLGSGGPVLLQLDDLQWADPESVQALTWLLERAAGDRLLVVAGARPLAPRDHDAWQRFVASSRNVHTLQLNGLSVDLATDLIQGAHPGVSADVAQYLWEHTGGNPLYLTSLLREHDRTELSRMRVLPAPAEFARTLSARVERLSEPAIHMLRATAVLGPNWMALPEVALVGRVDAPTDAAAELAAHELLLQRATNPGLSVRLPHALVRAAVYQYIPLPERRELHLRAAAVVDDESSALEHRVAAAEQFDDSLADELEAFARERHADREYRVAAQHYRWSSRVTSDSLERNRRSLDGLFESVLAGDLSLVRDELPEVGKSKNRARRALVAGAVDVLQSRWSDGSRLLAQGSSEEMDPLTRYRLEILLAWALVGAGGPTSDIAEGLERAFDQGVTDTSLDGYASFAAGQLAGRVGGAESMTETFSPLPLQAAATPLDLSYLLAWRGAVFVRRGFHEEAIADLSEVERRLQNGLFDISDGIFTTMLGSAHLEAGQVALADAKIRLALDSSRNPGNPMIQALASSVPVAVGDFTRAQEHLSAATTWLQRMPWPEALESLLIAKVILLHASGDTAARTRFIGEHRAMFGPRAIDPEGARSPLWIPHIALACVWAGELDDAERFTSQLNESPLSPGWVTAVRSWISGVIAEARSDHDGALRHFNDAESEWPVAMPLYRAHLHVDRARVAERLGDVTSTKESRAKAREIYAQAGAVGYFALLGEVADGSAVHASLAMLSDRERDVVALLASGLSYVQIARDLYISRSTVGFHLSNIYAKTGTTNRHELTDLVRA